MNRILLNVSKFARYLGAVMAMVPSFALAQTTAAPRIENRNMAGASAYWNAEKMRNATPMHPGLAGAARLPSAALQPSGSPGVAGGTFVDQRGHVKFLQYPRTPSAAAVRATSPIPADGSYPGPHATYEYGPRYRTYPISTIGKLFFTKPGVGDFVCSAAVTTGSASINNIIWTAGHCVAEGGQSTWYTNFLFCPSYDSSQGGPNPAVGCWTWSYATTNNTWFSTGSWSRDWAIIGLAHSGSVINADVATVTGGLGFAWNWGRDRQWSHLGYPSAPPFSGGKLVKTDTEHRYDDASQGSPATNSWGSAQTPGSSGSALILYFNYTGAYQPNLGPGNWINSDVSYYYTSPNQYGFELQGPYFDTAVCDFWKGNTGWSGTC